MAIKPSRQFKNRKPTKIDKQLEIAKIKNLNADTAKDLLETQAAIFNSRGPNKASKEL